MKRGKRNVIHQNTWSTGVGWGKRDECQDANVTSRTGSRGGRSYNSSKGLEGVGSTGSPCWVHAGRDARSVSCAERRCPAEGKGGNRRKLGKAWRRDGWVGSTCATAPVLHRSRQFKAWLWCGGPGNPGRRGSGGETMRVSLSLVAWQAWFLADVT